MTKEKVLYIICLIVSNFVHFIVLGLFKVITNLFEIQPQVKEIVENVDDALKEL